MASLPMADGACDVVLCQHGLQYLPNKHAALTEMHRMLRASGRLVLSMWRLVQYTPGHAIFADVLERHVSAGQRGQRGGRRLCYPTGTKFGPSWLVQTCTRS
jgi:SAM-dependent methyltransferase